ncbi:carboxylate--amine ligase [Nitrincola sp. A-D6]|uniref:DEAD/DEAH box helicase n=1 Tax=Nitrincola sp. A-D6 TaxID=1545442 RepID=UPI00051FD6C7|nr:DEAD/DEAH box helicase [Nitrincola sp. A-D6]KGK42552.1 carboxylate--amine ligase [Nitrincola sp. A-D6]
MQPIILRNYQRQAVEATLTHFRQSTESAVIVLPTGAGKSLVIAELARLARQRILVLTHVRELVEQNYAKYAALGLQAGIFSAGLQRRDNQHQVTFASIQSLAGHTQLFSETFSLVIIDECHRVSIDENSQYQQVLTHLRQHNPKLKLLGLTATPYRLGEGWIYRRDYRGFVRDTLSATFEHCIYELPLSQLIREGYLTPPICIDAATRHYDFSQLSAEGKGDYDTEEVNQLLHKYPRVTQAICEEIVKQAVKRKGVMIFAASVDHAQEIMTYLPMGQASLITGHTDTTERDQTLLAFKQLQIKYLVNISVLTTGFDAPHVDFIAILRPTRSVSLYQQIAGRGLRLYPDKSDCLIIDYAANGFNLFSPEVGSPKPAANTKPVQVFCPECSFANTFWGRTDDQGQVVEHFGRRCQGLVGETLVDQCRFRFRFRECPHCNAENDITARRCEQCKGILIDHDDLLKRALSLKDTRILRCAGMTFTLQGRELRVTYHDEDGKTLSEYFDLNQPAQLKVFNRVFSRWHDGTQRTRIHSAQQALKVADRLKHPDFVIARKHKHYWSINEKLFDYVGRHRKAYELY